MPDTFKKVSPDEMNRLFQFTREHFVEHYDLQAELADHLANAIETRWQQNPDITFEEALRLEFKKFGIFGFSDILESRQKALSKKYYKLLWGYTKQFLGLPKIIISIAAVVTTYLLIMKLPLVYAVLLIGTVVFSWGRLISNTRKYNRRKKQEDKRWLFEDVIMSCGGIGSLLLIPLQLNNGFFDSMHSTPLQAWLQAGVFVVFALTQYIALYVIPAKAHKHLYDTYPEYRFFHSR